MLMWEYEKQVLRIKEEVDWLCTEETSCTLKELVDLGINNVFVNKLDGTIISCYFDGDNYVCEDDYISAYSPILSMKVGFSYWDEDTDGYSVLFVNEVE